MSDTNKETPATYSTPEQPKGLLARFWAWVTGEQATREYNARIEALINPPLAPEVVAEMSKQIDAAASELAVALAQKEYGPAATGGAVVGLQAAFDDAIAIGKKRGQAAKAAVKKARGWIGKNTVYKLGSSTPGRQCDCSGFTASVYGYKRNDKSVLGPEDPAWHNTDSIAADALDNQDFYLPLAQPEIGCFVVYPGIAKNGKRIRIGHIGIVTEVPDKWTGDFSTIKVVHCSGGNYRKTGDAIQETNGAIWAGKQAHKGVTKKAYGSIFVMPKIEKLKPPKAAKAPK